MSSVKKVFSGIGRLRKVTGVQVASSYADRSAKFNPRAMAVINHELLRYCAAQHITFTRARPYRKNDNCYVEQKNYSIVRRAVGYQRFDTGQELLVLNQLYASLRLYTNFFLPTMKLKSKERDGSRIKKSYEDPLTPYRRALDSEHVGPADKKTLLQNYRLLNPAALKRTIDELQKQLFCLARTKPKTTITRRHKQQPLTVNPVISL